MRSRTLTVAASALALAVCADARAQVATPVTSLAPPDGSAARVDFLRDALARDASPSRVWFATWVSVYTVSTAGEAIVAVTASDHGLRVDAGVGVVKSAVGWLGMLIFPPPSLRTVRPLPPDATPEERAAWIDAESRHLQEAADAERLGRSWLAHLSVVVVNLAGSAYLWLHEDRVPSAILSAVEGVAVGELQIFTQPTHAIDDAATWHATLAPMATRGGAGLALSMGF